MEHVILVDNDNQPIGYAEKLDAHRQALLHRAFSVFIFRNTSAGIELLLQQRQQDKYHSGGQWTNTCCSHPRPEETILAAGQRRLREEMGIEAELSEAGVFHYVAEFANGLTENEMDHVLVGWLKHDEFTINPQEAAAARWINADDLAQELQKHADHFTPWFPQALAIASASINF